MNLYTLIKLLRNTASTNKKKEIIKKFFSIDDQYQQTLLRYYLDPDKVFFFSKKQIKNSEKHKIHKLDLFTGDIISGFTLLGLLNAFSSRKISGIEAEKQYQKFIRNLSPEIKELLNIILTKAPIGADLKLFNKVYKELNGKDFIKVFECQLANKYDEKRNYKVNHWFISPKLDGLRCLYRGGKLYTRQNKPIIGFEHLEEELVLLSRLYKLDIIDGELYSHELPFHEIQGAVTRNKNIDEENKKKIKFNIFACLGNGIENTKNMINTLNVIDKNFKKQYVTIVNQYLINNNPTKIKEWVEYYISKGYEGAMLRHPENHYDFKRSNNLLKVKFFNEDTFIIKGLFEGENKYKDKLGGFVVESLDGKLTARVGSGFSDKQREEFWEQEIDYVAIISNIANKFINDVEYARKLINEQKHKSLIGKKVEIKYFEVTPDNSLRFPVFLKLREDI